MTETALAKAKAVFLIPLYSPQSQAVCGSARKPSSSRRKPSSNADTRPRPAASGSMYRFLAGITRRFSRGAPSSVRIRLSARKDRHACIGEGFLGLETFRRIVNHPVLKPLPMCLETPTDLDGYAREIALLRSFEA